MKKNYILFTALLISAFGFSQAYNGAGDDELWSNTANWSNSTIVTSGAILNIWNNPTNIDVDVITTQKYIQNIAGRTEDITLSNFSETTQITVDNGNTNSSWAGQTTAYGVLNQTTAQTTFTVDCNLTFSNTETGFTVLRNDGHIENTIEMGVNSVLNLIGNGATGTWSDGNVVTRKFNFNGEIKGTQNFSFSACTINFGATSNNASYTGTFSLSANAAVTVDSENVFIDGTSGSRIQANSTAEITLNTANTMIGGTDIAVKNTSTFSVNINANQSGLGNLMYVTNGGGTIALTIDDSVENVFFESNEFQDWQAGSLEIYGFKEGVVKFGTNSNGLTQTQLSSITIDGPNAGDALALDENGYLILSASLSLDTTNTIDFTVYPNPVKQVLTISSNEVLQAVSLTDLLGKTVFESSGSVKTINIQNLSPGVYILNIVSENGLRATKKIIKE